MIDDRKGIFSGPNSKKNKGLSRPDEVRKKRGSSTVMFHPVTIVIYFVLGLIAFYYLPEQIIFHPFAREFSSTVSDFIPSIKAYSKISPEPPRVELFMALSWCLIPVHIYFMYLDWVKEGLSKKPTLPMSKMNALLSALFFLIGILAAAALPQTVSFDPNAIRASSRWENWMHVSLLPNALFALWIPPVVAAFATFVWLFATVPCSSSALRKLK